ncbi:MAG: alanine--tRNA ligase [Flavobacteriales bacterium]|nr:alanine--tRNA ligase [Flavobacteriales bacterium]
MKSKNIRKLFLNFFEAHDHKIVDSSSVVINNDPTLMFTNAGMNQFKNYFLSIDKPKFPRIANSQKCIRVSGKHNDLDEVGYDTYHHTMFEMLGNWSFGDYSKERAIGLAWDFLTKECKLDKNRIYVSVFEGDKEDGTEVDKESLNFWQTLLPEDQIVFGSKKDNFWEMGEIGPCGPCSEIHYDNRDFKELNEIKGQDLVNKDHPDVIEIWNLVFMQYNRRKSGVLEKLDSTHVDTGMGFERLCMIMQGVKSNYDTDVFQLLINRLELLTNHKYGKDSKKDIAMRVISDHIRAVACSIADGQLPSNNKAGYVIRRILRRAIRYGYTFLDQKQPFIFKLVDDLVENLGDHYNELTAQQNLISDVIKQEETSFLTTLTSGLKRLDVILLNKSNISGVEVFELYDTYGFPKDLTELILKEKGIAFDEKEFYDEMEKQKNRSKKSADNDIGEWEIVLKDSKEEFVGYSDYCVSTKISRIRTISEKNKVLFHIVLDKTPFYAESGGQIGDTGFLLSKDSKIKIIDTKKENNLIYHVIENILDNITLEYQAEIDVERRKSISRNHSATHLLHAELRNLLGEHVLQKGSLVSDSYLRFDFSHTSSLSSDLVKKLEENINRKIFQNILLTEHKNLTISEADKLGALMIFGEKYGDNVRMIQYGESKELCGGTHVNSTSEIGLIKILSESSVATGIRRIEASTGLTAIDFLNSKSSLVDEVSSILKNNNIISAINKLKEENRKLLNDNNRFQIESLKTLVHTLHSESEKINDFNFIAKEIDIDPKLVKELSVLLRKQDSLIATLATVRDNKVQLSISISNDLVAKGYDARKYINEIAEKIKGKGGGQAHFATAGGSNTNGINNSFSLAKKLLQ